MYKSLQYKNNAFIKIFSIGKIISILFVLFFIFLILFSQTCLVASKKALSLWANNVVPSLFPFFIATELLSYTNLSDRLSKTFSKIMKPLFGTSGYGAYPFVLGLISGYPVGAKIVTDIRNSGKCTVDEGNRLLAFTNNSSPLFIIGTVGISLFRSREIGLLLLISHILSSIFLGIILNIFSKKTEKGNVINIANDEKDIKITQLGNIFKQSISNSIKNILIIGGFIVLFAIIISILEQCHLFDILIYVLSPLIKLLGFNPECIKGLFIGILEITNGISFISSIMLKKMTLNILLSSFLLGFGGFSVLFQVLSIISSSDLSIKAYFYGKIIQGIISVLITYILMSNFSIFNFNL